MHSCGYHYTPAEYFPDSGCYDKWSRKMRQVTGLQYIITSLLEQYPANTDLADLLLHPP